MDFLPLEIRREILRHLDLNDLTRCRLVSRGMKEGADAVLSSIRCIHHKEELSDDPWMSPYTFLWLNSAPKETIFRAEFSQKNICSLVQFITKKCSRITSLIAGNYSVCLNDIAALAPRLTYFSLRKIFKQSEEEDTIDAKSFVEKFTNLQCYDLAYEINETDMCHHVVAREYSLLPSNQLAQYDEGCPQHQPCHKMVEHRAMKSLRSIFAELPLSLHDIHPSSFKSLQLLLMDGSIIVPDNSPHFPNLLVVRVESSQNLNSMIRLLHFSPRLLAVRLSGSPDRESFPEINLLLSACPALQTFHYDPYDPEDGSNLVDIPVGSLDFQRLKSIRSFTWNSHDTLLKLTFPPLCHQIAAVISSKETVLFKFDERSYAFDPLSISFRRMSPFPHSVDIVTSDGFFPRLILPSLARLCPQMRLTFSFGSEDECRKLMVIVLPKVLEKTNVTEINLVSHDERERIYKSNLERFFMTIGDYPYRLFSITLIGRISCNLRSIIKAHVNRKFTISRDNSISPPETLVEIPSPSNDSPPVCSCHLHK